MKLLKKNEENYICHYLCRSYAWSFIVFIFSLQATFAQLTVSAIPTHEECPGEGMLTLSVQGADPGYPVNYKVYLLPNTTVTIFNNSGTIVSNLNDGTYLVVATQNINGNIVQDDIEVVVEDHTIPLLYEVSHVRAVCGPDGKIEVEVTSGNAVTYELMAGPVTRPPQTSDVFENIPAGQYQVRVTDNCGTGIVVTHTVLSNASVLSLGPPAFPDIQLPACDLITLAHDIAQLDPTIPAQTPITATITLHPPGGGAPVIYTQTINALVEGPDLSQIIPFYYNTPYYYDLEIVDACGVTYNLNNNLVLQQFNANGGYGDAGCPGKFLQISLTKYVAPYTIQFSAWPEGFDPLAYNPAHPGPFSDPVTSYGSESEEIAVPYGTYTFTVTDACGHSYTETLLLEEPEIHPTASPFNANCSNDLGGVLINIPGFEMVSATFTEVPDDYPGTEPIDVTGYINAEFKLRMDNMLPPGDYIAVVVDECGREFTVDFDIETSPIATIAPSGRVDCATGKGAARISSANALIKVIISSAPADFTSVNPVPHDASYNISPEGTWYMNNLPPGTYQFKVDDGCNENFPLTQTLAAYNTTNNELTITRHCGSFDLLLEHTSTSSMFVSYWLQKQLLNGQWGHPETGNVYPENTIPDNTNSFPVTNNQTMYSLEFMGDFRIVKRYQTFGTGNPNDDIEDTVECIEVLQDDFNFFDNLSLISIESLTCSGDIADVQVNAQGAEPINYTIISKNGEPFTIANGNNNIFYGLEPAEYEVYFEDPCGNFITQAFNVADLPSAVYAGTPTGLETCDQDNDGVETFDLALQNPSVLDGQNPATFQVTYHASQADADAGTNTLPYTYTTGSTTVYARVLNTLNTACHAVAMFDITVRPEPVLYMDGEYAICEGDEVTIYADPGFSRYEWNEVQGPNVFVADESGTHTLKVTDSYGCETTKTITVVSSAIPHIASVDISDWTEANNTITVITEQSPNATQNYEYSLDGFTWQDSNIFTGLPPGSYTAYVRDKFECGLDTGDVFLLTYPKFFTPNGDGTNDMWRIQFSQAEPDMLVYIFDRYGKLVKSFTGMDTGWDGTYNGARLPSTDYWFLVKRQSGKEYKGHFSMLR